MSLKQEVEDGKQQHVLEAQKVCVFHFFLSKSHHLYSDANVSKLIPFFIYAYIASTAAFYLRGAKFAGGAKGTKYLYSFNVIFYFYDSFLVTALL